jgi:hypothetical protein
VALRTEGGWQRHSRGSQARGGAIGEVGYEAVVRSGPRSRTAGSSDMMVYRAIEE